MAINFRFAPMRPFLGFVVPLLLLVYPVQTQADIVLDQFNDANLTIGFNGDATHITWQQEVVVGVTGELDSIQFFAQVFQNTGDPNQIEFFVNKGSPWQTDAHDYFALLDLESYDLGRTTKTINVDLSSAGISLNAGDHIVIGFHGVDGDVQMLGNHAPESMMQGYYAAGELYLSGSPAFDGRFDIGFRTYVNAIPEPATGWILGSIGLLIYLRRWRL